MIRGAGYRNKMKRKCSNNNQMPQLAQKLDCCSDILKALQPVERNLNSLVCGMRRKQHYFTT